MKRLALSLVALAGFTAGAGAADLIIDEPAMTAAASAVHDWNGVYVGVAGGFGSGTSTGTSGGLTSTTDISGGLLGATAGVNAQWDMFVLGAEADLAWSGISDSAPCELAPAFTCSSNVEWLGTVRARAGVAFDSVLLFATAGLAVGGVSGGVDPAFVGTTGVFSDTYVGWTAGVGGELAVTDDISLKAEYAYVDLGSKVAPAGTVAPLETTNSIAFHVIKAGVNFHF